MRILLGASALAALTSSCDGPHARPTASSPPSASVAASVGDDAGSDPIGRCADAARERPQDRCDRAGQRRRTSEACAFTYKQPACRDAFLAASSRHPAETIRTFTDACRKAYCPLLREPKPSMCPMAPEEVAALRMADKMARWEELNRAILEHDHGPQAAERLRLAASPPDPRPTVNLSDETRATISAKGGFITLPLAAAADESAFVAALRERGASSGVVLEAAPTIPRSRVSHVVAVLKAAGMSSVELREPCPRDPPPSIGPAKDGGLRLVVHIASDGVSFDTSLGKIGAGCKPGGPGPTSARKGGRIDPTTITSCARELKRARPEFKTDARVTITAAPAIPYRDVIDVMDALRGTETEELFPEVHFGVGR
jgi:biopolymer transport protein ExbD